MTEDEVQEWTELITKVCRGVSWDYPDLEFDDMYQTIWEILLVAQTKGKMMSPSGRYVRNTLKFAAKKYAGEQRKQHLIISPQYAYRTKDVGRLFETFFDRNDWAYAQIPEDAASELGNVALELSSDLSRAWDRMPDNYKRIIIREYVVHDVTDDGERYLLSTALSRMAEILNSYMLPKTGTGRVAYNNAAANAIIDEDRDGEGSRKHYVSYQHGSSGG